MLGWLKSLVKQESSHKNHNAFMSDDGGRVFTQVAQPTVARSTPEKKEEDIMHYSRFDGEYGNNFSKFLPDSILPVIETEDGQTIDLSSDRIKRMIDEIPVGQYLIIENEQEHYYPDGYARIFNPGADISKIGEKIAVHMSESKIKRFAKGLLPKGEPYKLYEKDLPLLSLHDLNLDLQKYEGLIRNLKTGETLGIGVDPQGDKKIIIDGSEPFVSRNHASITRKSGGLFLVDHSSNGTSLAGKYHYSEREKEQRMEPDVRRGDHNDDIDAYNSYVEGDKFPILDYTEGENERVLDLSFPKYQKLIKEIPEGMVLCIESQGEQYRKKGMASGFIVAIDKRSDTFGLTTGSSRIRREEPEKMVKHQTYDLNEKDLPILSLCESGLKINLKKYRDKIAGLHPGEALGIGRIPTTEKKIVVDIRENYISRQHLLIRRNEDGKLGISDCSANGTSIIRNAHQPDTNYQRQAIYTSLVR